MREITPEINGSLQRYTACVSFLPGQCRAKPGFVGQIRDLGSIVGGDWRRHDSSAVAYYNAPPYSLTRFPGKGEGKEGKRKGHGRPQDFFQGWAKIWVNPCLTFSSLPPHVPLPLSFPFPPLCPLTLPPLRSRPRKSSYGVCGSAVSSPSEVWGRAPAEIEFGAY